MPWDHRRSAVGLAVLLFLLAPALTMGQGTGRDGGFGGKGRDSNRAFDFLAKGRGYFLLNESNRFRDLGLGQFLQERGITSGQVTREVFAAFNDQMKAGSGGPPDVLRQRAEFDFRARDRNGDGFLSQDEMPDPLKAELSKWDANRDNLISLDEYKFYYAARKLNRRGSGSQIKPTTIIIEEDLEARLFVYRAGKLPKNELPSWFVELDTNKDGQVALYEWRKAGKKLDEFRSWDRNNDGFITAEEAIYRQRLIRTTVVQDVRASGGRWR